MRSMQPPSPLIFSPETVLSPLNSNNVSSSNPQNTVSMPFVRRHVTRRLKAAKAECDRELQRVTNNITAFFEERLREGDDERELREFQAEQEHLRDSYSFHPSDLRSALQADESGSEASYDPDTELSGRHSRQRGYPEQDTYFQQHSLTRSSSSSGIAASSNPSLSPGSHRRLSGNYWDRPLSSSVSANTVASSPANSSVMLPEAPITRKQQSSTASSPAWSTSQGPSRRLSRSIHIPTRSRSGRSSRSTSRSRSPLPQLSAQSSQSEYGTAGPSTTNRRASRILVDDPVDPIMTALYDLIGVATDITEMSVTQLTAQPKVCESLVGRVQNIGKAWDDHPDWHGRNWYVQVLLAVASLSRVVEWWEAEKQFWNFDDNDAELDEPLMFVAKPAEETTVPTPTVKRQSTSDLDSFKLDPEDENKLRLTRPTSQGRRSRDAHPKELTLSAIQSEDHTRASSQQDRSESARILATERLRLQAETAQNQNIVMELSLDGDHLIWVNYAWNVVVGTDPEDLYGTRISRLLAPGDWNVFRDATNRLQEDDSHTVEARFRLQVEPEEGSRDVPPPGCTLYQQMEGKGMLMIDREDGEPSHTMWVVRPLAPPRYENDSQFISLEKDDIAPEPASSFATVFQQDDIEPPPAAFPFPLPISTDPILCRICECQIPQWYFEKHSETCAETHRLEAEIAEFNESIDELRNTIRDLAAAMDRENNESGPPPEYRGMPIYSPSSSPVAVSPLQLLSRTNKMQRLGVKRIQRRLLDQLDDILQVAAEVSIPSLKEEEAKEPIERQRLLSPSSDRKITQIRTWAKPTMEDNALSQLIVDAERVMRGKVDNVVRMQNTIRYAEKIWREWEEKVAEMVGEDDDDSTSSGSGSHEDEDALPVSASKEPSEQALDEDDHSSTVSEYAFGDDSIPSSDQTPVVDQPPPLEEPTPVAVQTPAAQPTPIAEQTPTATSPPPSQLSERLAAHSPSRPVDIPAPASYPVRMHTRSSTPSSISSPLALAEPIIAPATSDTPPPMRLDSDVTTTPSTIKTRSSHQNLLEPKVVVTPPASPQVIPKDAAPPPPSKRDPSRRRHSTINPTASPPGPLSPRHPSTAPMSRTNPTSIKDFEIIKPISKGAFGSVFLAKKKVTGDYYAIKVLKKADMIAKNQITNVKAERMILMKQAESPFVAKLFFTFQSKENLYLVMEYLNGGDCAALIKSLGCLPEEWTRNYIAEVILGLEYLHERGIVHRDLKPDNLLIDQHGHLKLTDFGLSRIGLLGRQTREREAQLGRPPARTSSRSRPPSMDSAYLSSPLTFADITAAGGSYFSLRPASVNRHPYSPTDDASESSGSEPLLLRRNLPRNDSPLQSFASELTTDLRSHSHSASGGGGTPPGPGEQKFAGTPDYLAPETILGLRGDDAAVDWWALGVITYEFLYGIPPFHAETPEKVFENILSGHIEWHEEYVDFSEEARDFMARLMTLDPAERLGANGAQEVKAHPFLHGIEWDKVTSTEAAFIPQITDPESTDYFDPRGAIPQLFQDDDQIAVASNLDSPIAEPSPALPVPTGSARDPPATSPSSDDFGSFSFKNLPVLKQANDDVIRKLKTDQMAPISHALSEPTSAHSRKRSISHRMKKPPSVVTAVDPKSTNPPSPATSTSSLASSPSRSSIPTTPGSAGGHVRKHSEYGAVERFKVSQLDSHERRSSVSMPSRLRTASVSSAGDGSSSENWNSSSGGHDSMSNEMGGTPPSSVHSIDLKHPTIDLKHSTIDLKKGPDPNDRAVTCLLAEDNPITAKIIETLLIRLGCRCVVVADGSEAISVAMGDIQFDCILMDLHMPVLDGEGAARYIKSTNSKNTSTPIVAVSAYSDVDPYEESKVFSAYLGKPVQKADLLSVMRQLGFKTHTMPGPGPTATKVTASVEQPTS